MTVFRDFLKMKKWTFKSLFNIFIFSLPQKRTASKIKISLKNRRNWWFSGLETFLGEDHLKKVSRTGDFFFWRPPQDLQKFVDHQEDGEYITFLFGKG